MDRWFSSFSSSNFKYDKDIFAFWQCDTKYEYINLQTTRLIEYSDSSSKNSNDDSTDLVILFSSKSKTAQKYKSNQLEKFALFELPNKAP